MRHAPLITPEQLAAIARVDLLQGGKIVGWGTAFLVDPSRVITALHVVELSRPDTPPHDRIRLSFFPRARILAGRGTLERTAVRIADRHDPGLDWVMLALDRPITDVTPLVLHTALPRGDDPFCVYGFPRVNARDGITFKGHVVDPNALYDGNPALQLFSPQLAAPNTRIGGLSGAPVFVDGAVVALVRSAPTVAGVVAAGTVYACPVSAPLQHVERPAVQALTLPPPLEDPSRFRLLVRGDFLPSATAPAALLVGHRPSLKLLRDHQYMARAAHLADAVDELERMLSDRASAAYPELHTFWITGRSGSGKSVLLLQLMDRMVDRGRRVVWLDNDSSAVLRLLSTVHPDNKLADEYLPDLAFVDDVYSPGGQLQLALEEIQRMIARAPEHRWPLLVTCGPPEFEQRLARETGDDGFHITTWRLPPVDPDEARALQQWFRSSTGKQAEPGAAFQQADGLMVSMAFEMLHGTLGPFALRFKKRLEASRLDEPLYVPLAMNRLYLNTPASWLNDDEWDRLDALNREGDFELFELPHGARYLRLTHPHISDAIYRAVRDDGTPKSFARDLAKALRRARDTDLFTFRQLLRELMTGNDRLDAVDMHELVEVAGRDWRTSDMQGLRQDPAALAEVLTGLATWAGHRPDLPLDQHFGAPLLVQALAALGAVGNAWPIFWSRLDKAYAGDLAVRTAALEWLEQPASEAARDWVLVWRRVWGGQTAHDPEVYTQLLRRGWAWLRAHPEGEGFASVLTALLNAATPPDIDRGELIACGCDWVKWRMDRGQIWFEVWQRILVETDLAEDRRVDLLERGATWLTSPKIHAWQDWTLLWNYILDEPRLPPTIERAGVLALGLKPLRSADSGMVASRIWKRFLAEPSRPDGLTREELLAWGIQCVEDTDRRDWPSVWETMYALPDFVQAQRDAFLRAGFRWLRGHEDNVGWSHALRILLSASALPDDVTPAAVIASGFVWLDTMGSARAFTYVWSILRKAHARWPDLIDLNALAAHAARWIKQDSDHPSIPYIAADALAIASHPRAHDEVALWLGRWISAHTSDRWMSRILELIAPALPRLAASGADAAGCTLLHNVLSRRSTVLEAARAAQQRGEFVTGRIEKRLNYGFRVELSDDLHGFLPDRDLDALASDDSFMGSTHDFVIHTIDPHHPMVRLSLLRTHDIAARAPLIAARARRQLIEGTITQKVKGGHQVTLEGHIPAFLPFRETDDHLGDEGFVGSTRKFALLDVSHGKQPIVSLRSLLPDEVRDALLAARARAETLTGSIERVLSDGFLVAIPGDIIPGDILGFLPSSEIAKDTAQKLFLGCPCELSILSVEDDSGLTVSLHALREPTALRRLLEAQSLGSPVQGKIGHRVAGGYRVMLQGNIIAYLPNEQVDAGHRDAALIGSTHEFIVFKANTDTRTIVSMLVQAQALFPGQLVECVITAFNRVCAIVQLGPSKGIIYTYNLRWRYLRHPSEAVQIGQHVTARVLAINTVNNEVELGLKQTTESPWPAAKLRYTPQTPVRGKVTQVVDFGIFVELDEHTSGLLHINQLGLPPGYRFPYRRYRAGDEVAAVVLSFEEADPPKIALKIHQLLGDAWLRAAADYPVGRVVSCVVAEVTADRARVTLEGGLHGWIDGAAPAPDAAVEVEVVQVDVDVQVIRVALRSPS